MTCYLDKHTQKQNRRLANQVVTLQEDLSRLSGIVTHLAELSDEGLAAFEYCGPVGFYSSLSESFRGALFVDPGCGLR